MAYVTIAQLSARLGSTLYARLTDRVNGTTADDTVAQQVVEEAEAEADSYLARRYQTPLDLSAHPELANVLQVRVLDLAEYGTWKSSPFVSDPPQRVHSLARAAVNWFADVASGRLALPAASAPAPTTATDDGPRVSASERKFTAGELDGL